MKTGVLGSVMAELRHDVMIGRRNPNRLHKWQVTTLRRLGTEMFNIKIMK